MSGPKCVDTRTTQLRANRQIMEQLQRSLAATPLAVSTDRVQIRTSQITTIQESSAVAGIHQQDTIEGKDTSAVQSALTAEVKNDYTASKLADWQPFDMSKLDDDVDPQVELSKDARDPISNMKLEEDFFSSILGSCFAVVNTGEVDDNGEELVALAVDVELLDDHGEWKDKKKKAAWDDAVGKAMAASRSADGPDRTAKTKQDNAKLLAAQRAAGGAERKAPHATQATSTAPARTVEKPKVMGLGGKDD
ncbi:MAG TPA: hypothetical protein VGO62_07505 [Myxococcota bacterium]